LRPRLKPQTQGPEKQRRREQNRPLAKTQRNDIADAKILTQSQTRYHEPTRKNRNR
jgi:hypothetical protein